MPTQKKKSPAAEAVDEISNNTTIIANKNKNVKRNGLVGSYCEGCKYYFCSAHDHNAMCEYFNDTGEIRPCPAGDGCTCYEKGKKKRSNYNARLY